MGIAPREPSSSPTGTGLGKGGTPPPRQLTEVQAREVAPWRPFDDKGVLIKPLKTARDAKTLFAACEKTLIAYPKAVCLWPAKECNQTWRVPKSAFDTVLDMAGLIEKLFGESARAAPL